MIVRMKREIKRVPSDYPQFAFRVSEEDKRVLMDLVEDVRSMYNSGLKENEKVFNKNEIIIMALKKGLAAMKKTKK